MFDEKYFKDGGWDRVSFDNKEEIQVDQRGKNKQNLRLEWSKQPTELYEWKLMAQVDGKGKLT